MGDPTHCAATCRRWALACWRSLSPARRNLVLQLADGKARFRSSLVWAEQAGLTVDTPLPELTPLGRLVASVGAAEMLQGGAS